MISSLNQFAFFSVLLGMLALSANDKPFSMASTEGFDMQGHRGARGLFPEHTEVGFQAAVDAGMTTLELDVHYTSDRQFVLFHDHKISRDNASGPAAASLEGRFIHELASEQLQQIDVGSRAHPDFPNQIATAPVAPLFLGPWLQWVNEKSRSDARWHQIRFNIEIKLAPDSPHLDTLPELVADLLRVLDQAQVTQRCCIQSFHLPAIQEVHKHNPSMLTSALFSTTRLRSVLMKIGLKMDQDRIVQQTVELGATVISPHYTYCSSAFVKTAQTQGLRVIPWTVNDPNTMQQLIHRGVDGLISDYPNLLAEAVKTSLPNPLNP